MLLQQILFVVGLNIYLKYRQVQELLKRYDQESSLSKLNERSVKLGITAAFGVSVVGNFQESNILTIHLFGAFLAFQLGNVYMIISTMIYNRLLPFIGTKRMKNIKFALGITSTVACNVSFVFAAISLLSFTGTDTTKWKKEDGGFTSHLISTVTEWICAICTMGYILSFSEDFKTLHIQEPEVTIIDNHVLAADVTIVENNHI